MEGRPSQNQPATARSECTRCTTVTATPLQCLGRHNTSTDQQLTKALTCTGGLRFTNKIQIPPALKQPLCLDTVAAALIHRARLISPVTAVTDSETLSSPMTAHIL